MPLYEYRCGSCEERFEVLQRLGEGAEGLSCPECGEVAAERVFSTFAAGTSSSSSSMSAAPGCERPGCGSGFT